MSDYDYLFKVIVVGDGAVGKTALTIRFSEGRFQDHYKMTIGVDFAIKLVEINGKKVKLQIWDTGGQERFSYIRPLYYKGAMSCIYVFDITNRSSYDHLNKWYKEVSDYCGGIPALLVANKCDLPDKAVTVNEAQQMAAQLGGPFYEASAKTGNNVDDLFTTLAKILIAQEGMGAPTPAPVARAPTPPPAPRPAPVIAPPPPPPAPRPAPAPIRAVPVAGPAQKDSLEEALSFLSSSEEEPAPIYTPPPAPAPRVTPVPVPEPEPVYTPEPEPYIAPEPAPFTAYTPPADPVPASAPAAAPSPFTSFLTTAAPQETHQPSAFIPFIPEAPAAKPKPAIKPVPATPSQPVTLEVAPKPAPTSQAPGQACPNCGKIISPRWLYCTHCGFKLRDKH